MHRNAGSESTGLAAGWGEVSGQETRAQLARILDSPQFRSSKRCSQFLRYVVESASEGRFDSLKERTLGIEVFDRDPRYDTNQDPVVRTTAGEVRKRLAQYYLEPAHEKELRIALPAGSYMPEVHPVPVRAEPAKVEPPSVEPVAALSPKPQIRRRFWRWIAAGAVGLLAAAVPLVLSLRSAGLDAFWSPVIRTADDVLICIGQPKAYHFSGDVQRELDRWFEGGAENRNPPAMTSMPLADVVPAWDWYVAVEDAQAYSRLASLFAAKGKPVVLRGARSVSLADLRGKPAVLIGAFNNEWTLGLAGELRYYFDADSDAKAQVVRDRRNPGKADWRVAGSWPRKRIPEDYAIVTRVLNKTTEQTVVIAAGITRYGTQAAGEFLTNRSYFEAALAGAPSDWRNKNMQVVLSVKVMSGAAGPPKVLATHYW